MTLHDPHAELNRFPYRYVFSGVVHPERAHVTISSSGLLAARLVGPGGAEVVISLDISEGRIGAVLHTERLLDHLVEWKHAVEASVQRIVDTYGFLHGCGYDVEIIQAQRPNDSHIAVFGVNIPVL